MNLSRIRPRYPVSQHLSLALAAAMLTACGAVQTASSKVADMALNVAGVRLPEVAAPRRADRFAHVRIAAAGNLNADEHGRGLSAIVRVYRLKDRNAFLAAPYAAFGHAEKEKQALGSDLLDVSELILAPGQTLEFKEKMNDETAYLGVVALFRVPDQKRWRFAFTASDAESSGVTLGLHACAMTATAAAPSGMAPGDAALLSPVKCQ